jgi:hypothetical protein
MQYLPGYNFANNKYEKQINDHMDENWIMAMAWFLKNENDSANLYVNEKWPFDITGRKGEVLLYTKQYRQALAFFQSEVTEPLNNGAEKTEDVYTITPQDSLGISSGSGGYAYISNIYLNMAICYSGLQQNDSAIFYLTKSLDAAFKSYGHINANPQIHYYSRILIEGFRNVNHIAENPSIGALRKIPGFTALMKKYFPNQY